MGTISSQQPTISAKKKPSGIKKASTPLRDNRKSAWL
jgi:hypothetical protein